jgi:AcrR family transcriptional regulator
LNPTKARILKTALSLFNERGSGNVSTRHIAEELTMSPGNLYYHYPHKEAIVQALFTKLNKTWDEAYAFSSDEPLTLTRIAEMLEVTFEIVWQYRSQRPHACQALPTNRRPCSHWNIVCRAKCD